MHLAVEDVNLAVEDVNQQCLIIIFSQTTIIVGTHFAIFFFVLVCLSSGICLLCALPLSLLLTSGPTNTFCPSI